MFRTTHIDADLNRTYIQDQRYRQDPLVQHQMTALTPVFGGPASLPW